MGGSVSAVVHVMRAVHRRDLQRRTLAVALVAISTVAVLLALLPGASRGSEPQRPVVANASHSALDSPGIGTSGISSFSVRSVALGHTVPVAVYLPPHYPAAGTTYPVLILLHGVPGQGAQTLQTLNLAGTLNTLISTHQVRPMIVVAPSDGPTPSTDTEWINSRTIPTWRWGTFVDTELLSWISGKYSVCASRSGHALGGISMGGFGAINDALRALPSFGAVSLWSPYFVSNTPLVDGPAGSAGWRADSPLYSITTRVARLRAYPLNISFYVGKSDVFASQDSAFAKVLSSLKLPYRYSLESGGHDGQLWQANIPSEFRWLSSVMHC